MATSRRWSSPWFGTEPRIVIPRRADQGIDVGAKSAVYQLIADMVADGLSVILISSELPEVMHPAHRVVVMHRGHQVAELSTAKRRRRTLSPPHRDSNSVKRAQHRPPRIQPGNVA